jgi:hypothetical protein
MGGCAGSAAAIQWTGVLDSQPDWYDGGNPGVFEDVNNASGAAQLTFTIKADGTFTVVGTNAGNIGGFGSQSWVDPASTAVTRSWWVRFSKNAELGVGSSTAATGWLQLNTDRAVSVSANNGDSDGGNEKYVNYKVEFSTNSAGTPIAQETAIQLYAYSLSS